MRHKFSLFALLALLVIGAMSFAGSDAPDKAEAYAPPAVLAKTWTLDTIANAANDTLSVPFTQAFQITRTSISGTANLAVTVQMSVTSSSTTDATWVTVATTSATTATPEVLTLAESYGQRYRVIIDGTGTQSSSYQISWLAKRLPN